MRCFDLDEVWEEIKTNRRRFCVPTDGLEILRKYLRISSPGLPDAPAGLFSFQEAKVLASIFQSLEGAEERRRIPDPSVFDHGTVS